LGEAALSELLARYSDQEEELHSKAA
jgi:hypothetical protein